MNQSVYIQRLGAFLPGAPVANEDMEAVLGQVGAQPSRARRIVLRSNGIRSRHYALDPRTGAATHDNAQLTAMAIRQLFTADSALETVDLLACGTSTPDQLMPGHAAMVHGELGNPPCETASLSGICLSGINALRYAAMAVAGGMAQTAVATGSELASSLLRATAFDDNAKAAVDALRAQPEKAFHRDFLRWMLSDGAGAMLLRNQPATTAPSLRIDWIEHRSFANKLPTCMYAGANKQADGRLRGWRQYVSPVAAAQAGAFTLKQDVRLLNDNIVEVSFRDGLAATRAVRPLEAEAIDWFVPHYSSEYFRPRLAQMMQDIDFVIPESRWFTNLTEVGNVGAASIYLMLEALMASGRLRAGQHLLCFVPESGRFATAFMHLTVMAAAGAAQ